MGLVAGTMLALAAWAGARRVTPDDPASGMAQAMVINLAAMLAALGGLALFFFVARETLPYFGGALVTAFVVAAVVLFLRAGRTQSAH